MPAGSTRESILLGPGIESIIQISQCAHTKGKFRTCVEMCCVHTQRRARARGCVCGSSAYPGWARTQQTDGQRDIGTYKYIWMICSDRYCELHLQQDKRETGRQTRTDSSGDNCSQAQWARNVV